MPRARDSADSPRRANRTFALALALALAALAVLASAAPADVVHLKGGGRLVGRVEETGDTVRVTLSTGTVTIARERVESIERAELPSESLDRRIRELGADDVEGALALADEAEADGLPDAAGRALERAVTAAPDDARVRAAAYRWRVLVRRLPPDPDGDARLLAKFGEGAKLHATDHFRIAYDVLRDDARRRGELLEAAYRKVHELSVRLGIEAHPIDRRLDVLLFSDHARWAAAIGKPADRLRGMSGLYVCEDGRVYLFDTDTLPEARKARKDVEDARAKVAEAELKLAAQRKELEPLLVQAPDPNGELDARSRDFADKAAAARTALRDAQARIDAERARIDAFERELAPHLERENVATTTHEACHQLTFATGICRPGQPVWLLEGMATLFEVTNRTSFVPEAPNPVRLADLRSAWAAGRTSRLEDVVSDAVFTAPGADTLAAYAEAWSLSHFLSRRHGAEFARFVRECRALPEVPSSAAARVEDFRRVFGADLDALDREWKDDVRHLPGQ